MRLSRLATLAVFALAIGLGGCSDNLLSENKNDLLVDRRFEGDDDGSKFRMAHLMDRAMYAESTSALKNKGKGKGKDKGGGGQSGSGDATSAETVSLDLLLAFDDGASELQKQAILERYRVLERYRILERYEYTESFNGVSIESTVDADDASAFQDLIALLDADPDIVWFEPDIGLDAGTASTVGYANRQYVPWSVAAIGGRESWTRSGDGSGVVSGVDIFVIDSGVSNPDITIASSENVRLDETDLMDRDGHGTHVAGIIAADDDDNGLVGVAPGARIHSLKVLDSSGNTDISTVLASLEYVLSFRQGHPDASIVVNMSLGENIGTTAYTALDRAIAKATTQGILFVVAAGNQGVDVSTVTPAHVEGVITVGSYDPDANFSGYSNYGSLVDIMAPGSGVVSLPPGGTGGWPVQMSGTSMAAAHVTGAAALYLSLNPGADPQVTTAALLSSARDIVRNTPQNTSTAAVWVGEDEPGNRLVMVVGNSATISSKDVSRTNYFESWGFEVAYLDDDADGPKIDEVLKDADVVFVSYTVDHGTLSNKLKFVPVGTVSEESIAGVRSFGFSNSVRNLTSSKVNVIDNTHPITSGMSTGSVTVASEGVSQNRGDGTIASGLNRLAVVGSKQWPTLAYAEAGASMINGPATGRRVRIPFGNGIPFETLTDDGRQIVRNALDWAVRR